MGVTSCPYFSKRIIAEETPDCNNMLKVKTSKKNERSVKKIKNHHIDKKSD